MNTKIKSSLIYIVVLLLVLFDVDYAIHSVMLLSFISIDFYPYSLILGVLVAYLIYLIPSFIVFIIVKKIFKELPKTLNRHLLTTSAVVLLASFFLQFSSLS